MMAKSPASRLLRDSEAAWNRQDYQRSIELLEQASRMAPEDPCYLLDLGRAHGMRYDYPAAEKCFEKAIRVSRWHVSSFVAAGLHCVNFGQHGMAGRYFERALQRAGDSTEALVQLAAVYERQHRLDTAADLVERALQRDPQSAPALLVRARLDRQAGRLDQAEARLRPVVGKSHADVWTHAQAWYELGGILDRQERFDEAMAAFLEAKALMQPAAAPFIAKLRHAQARAKKDAELTSAEILKTWVNARDPAEPSGRLALLCGHPRSGTTLLEQVLDSHPGIVSAEESRIFVTEAYLPLTRGISPEPDSLLAPLSAASPELLNQSRAAYLRATEAFLGNPVGDRLLIDKNPSLTPFIPAVVRLFPRANFLVALRDPRDVCLSCFMQPLSLSAVSAAYLTLEGTVGEYASVMGFWTALKPRMPGAFLEVRYEDVVKDLESAAHRALEFLGVPWDARVLRFDEHARAKLVRSPTYADVAKPVFKGAMGRWRNYRKHLEPLLDQLDPFVKAFGYE